MKPRNPGCRPWKWLAAAALMLCSIGWIAAAELRLVAEESVFAVITRKGGFAAGLAHDHLVAAGSPTIALHLDPALPLEARMELTATAEGLLVDDPGLRERWYPRLEALGVLDEPFGAMSDKDRDKVRKAMLSAKQLDGEAFPEIKARIVDVQRGSPSDAGADHENFVVLLELTVRGRSSTGPAAATYQTVGNRTTIEATGTFRFTDLEIKPYSAMFGAVKNQDTFHVYAYLALEPGRGGPPAKN